MSPNRAETECAACGRFIGSWERCPFCRHFNPKRPVVRIIKYSMPILTILGILWLAHLGKIYGKQPATVAELGRKANFAQVVITGVVAADVRFHAGDAETGNSSLEFEVDDGTGQIRIRCYDDAYDELKAAGKIPGRGDKVRLVGNYQYKARRQFIILSSAMDLDIQREVPTAATAIAVAKEADAHGLAEGQRILITGKINRKLSGNYDFSLWLADPEGRMLTVIFSKSLLEAYGMANVDTPFWQALKEGDFVTAVGSLKWYQGRKGQYWQLNMAAPADVRPSDEETWKKHNGGN